MRVIVYRTQKENVFESHFVYTFNCTMVHFNNLHSLTKLCLLIYNKNTIIL